MKRLLTVLVLILLAAGFSFESFAVDTFDVSFVGGMDMTELPAASETASEAEEEQPASLVFFARFLKDAAVSTLAQDLGFNPVHGQPLPGVLITLLLGAAFGLARRIRGSRHSLSDEQNAAGAMLIVARLFRMNILFLNPPETIHAISPGPDLFCLRE